MRRWSWSESEQAATPAKSSEMPTHTMTAVVPNASGWKRIQSEQSSSRMPLKIVQPDPAICMAPMSLPSPMAPNARSMSQNPRNIGSVAAESATLKIRMMPSTISMMPPASIQPRPVMKCLLTDESTTSRMPEISISHPNRSDMPR